MKSSEMLRTYGPPGAAIGLAATATAGVSKEVGSLSMPILPEYYPQIVDALVATNNGVRLAAPSLAVVALGVYANNKIQAWQNPHQRAKEQLANTEYSGTDTLLSHEDTAPSYMNRVRRMARKVFGLTGVTIALTGSMSSLEHEISQGPLRPVDGMTRYLGIDDQDPYQVVLQNSNVSLMDDSIIKSETVQTIVADVKAQDESTEVIPFRKRLFVMDDKPAMQFIIPDELFTKKTNQAVTKDCNSIPAIVDTTLRKQQNDSLTINGKPAHVVQRLDEITQMNRHIAIIPDTKAKNCIEDGADQAYSGMFIYPKDHETVSLPKSVEDKVAIISNEKFRENNTEFWEKNGTPVIVVVMGAIAVLSTAASAGLRKSQLQRNSREIGVLNVRGVKQSTLFNIENRRALNETVRSLPGAILGSVAITAAFNAAEQGMRMEVDAQGMTTGMIFALGANLVGAAVAGHDMRRMNLARAKA